MYITDVGFKLSFLFELNFWLVQTDIIMQQTQRNSDNPPTKLMSLLTSAHQPLFLKYLVSNFVI